MKDEIIVDQHKVLEGVTESMEALLKEYHQVEKRHNELKELTCDVAEFVSLHLTIEEEYMTIHDKNDEHHISEHKDLVYFLQLLCGRVKASEDLKLNKNIIELALERINKHLVFEMEIH